jgi:hypothetical protein
MWQIWRFTMFLSISLPLSRNLTPSLSYHVVSYVNESRRWQTFSLFALSELVYSLFSLSELVCTNKEFYPIILLPLLSHPKLLPLWSVTDRQTEGRTTFFTPYGSFFSLSARGPTRRRNSTGLAELWGGWPIEQVRCVVPPHFFFYLGAMDGAPQSRQATKLLYYCLFRALLIHSVS